MSDFKYKIKDIPKSPGVYEFKNKDGVVIYIGKAKNLRNRLGQYFSGHDTRPQLPYLLAEATDIGYTVVGNELESLFLENTLIKKHLPKYNIQLRDDKNYAFIKIDYSFEIPQIGYARKVQAEGAGYKARGHGRTKDKYFGPYSAAYRIRHTLNLVRRIFPYCSNKEIGKRPCFYYYLHRCPGVCVGKITLEEYNEHLDRICEFLSGQTGKIKKELVTEMKIASSEQHYELAGRLRDQLQALELLDEHQNAIMPKPVSWDIVSIASDSGYVCINLFKIRAGKMQGKENFVYETDPGLQISSQSTNVYEWETLQKFLEQYYLDASDIPKVIYTQVDAEDAELINHIVRSRFDRKVKIITPQKSKPKELIDLGKINASEYVKNWLSGQAGHLDKINEALTELQTQLHLPEIPNRIECYDISNIQGTNAVGSMVVFEKGLPAKSQYRKFKIKGKSTPDDFAMMKEMLTRRLARSADESKFQMTNDELQTDTTTKSKWPLPDLIVIDGGKGQLSSVVEILSTYHSPLNTIPVVGLAKRIEEIFFPGNNEPLILSHDNPALQMLQRLRDETHRFGITFHRDLRSKQLVKSALDQIPGIGPKTKKLLKTKFGTVANIRKASHEEIEKIIGPKLAQVLKENL